MSALSGVGSRRSKLVFAGSVYLVLIAMTAVFLFPLLWVIGLSLKTRLQVFANPPLFLWWPTLENYAGVLGQADFLQAFINSLVVSSGAVLLSICVVAIGLATGATLYCLLSFLAIAAACMADGSSNTLWMRKAPASHKASILALVHMTTVFTKAGALLGGGLLVDHLLEPAMAASGALAQVLGPWLGVGKGRGIALLFVASGCIGLVLSLAALAWRRTRRIDFAHPDGDAEAPGAVLN